MLHEKYYRKGKHYIAYSWFPVGKINIYLSVHTLHIALFNSRNYICAPSLHPNLILCVFIMIIILINRSLTVKSNQATHTAPSRHRVKQ